jgi:hypothetical protein
MTVTLNEAAFDRAEKLIMDGEFVLDDRSGWSEHQPTAAHLHGMFDAPR